MSETTGLRAVNTDQLASSIQRIATSVAGAIAARGYIAENEVELWGGLIATIALVIWDFISNRDANLINAAINVPAVSEVVVQPAAVDSLNTKKETSRKLTAGRGQPYR